MPCALGHAAGFPPINDLRALNNNAPRKKKPYIDASSIAL